MTRRILTTGTRETPRAGDLIGYRKDGRPIYLIGGGSDDHNGDDSGDDGADDSGDDSDDDGDDDLIGSGDDDTEDDEGDDSSKSGGTLSEATIAQITKAAVDAANQVADKRINQALNKRGGNKSGSKRSNDDGGGTQQQQAGPAASDVREARMVYREYIGDSEFRFTDPAEREVGNQLAQAIIGQQMADGADIDTAGQRAATEVEKQLAKVRKVHQRQVLANLKRQGVLPDSYKPQAKSGGPRQRASERRVPDGAKIAEEMFPEIKDKQSA